MALLLNLRERLYLVAANEANLSLATASITTHKVEELLCITHLVAGVSKWRTIDHIAVVAAVVLNNTRDYILRVERASIGHNIVV